MTTNTNGCPPCYGQGFIDGIECEMCEGTGRRVPPEIRRKETAAMNILRAKRLREAGMARVVARWDRLEHEMLTAP